MEASSGSTEFASSASSVFSGIESVCRQRRTRCPARPTGPWSAARSAAAPSTNSAASASSGSTSVSVTSARPIGGPLGGAVENAVGHALGAQRFVALLAQDPGNGVHDIGLAAAVGSDDAGKPGAAEGDLRFFAERFEAHQFDFAQFKQDFPFYGLRRQCAGSAKSRRSITQRPMTCKFGRDEFRLLGKVRAATKSLKGRLAVAQPPGATMAVTGK